MLQSNLYKILNIETLTWIYLENFTTKDRNFINLYHLVFQANFKPTSNKCGESRWRKIYILKYEKMTTFKFVIFIFIKAYFLSGHFLKGKKGAKNLTVPLVKMSLRNCQQGRTSYIINELILSIVQNKLST